MCWSIEFTRRLLMSDHATAISDTGVCVGWGKTYSAYCTCGWWGRAQLHRFSAVADAQRHTELVAAADDAERSGVC